MAITVTRRNGYVDTATDGRTFSWTRWDGTNGDILTHIETGRQIYQMRWLNMDGKMDEWVTGGLKDQAVAFWAELEVVQTAPAQNYSQNVAQSKGICPKCHTYCDGDCKAH